MVIVIYFIILVVGVGVAVWLFFQETEKDKEKETPNLLDRLGISGTPSPKDKSEAKNPSFAAAPPSERPLEKTEPKELPTAEETSLDEIDRLSQYAEIQAKYEKLEILFKEKADELEKKENALDTELRAKKDFNKVKDILEKELKDTRDKNHKLQLEISAAQMEVETYKKRGLQLEEKIRTKEQNIKEQEQLVTDLKKRIETFATPKEPPKPAQPATSPKPDIIQPPPQPAAPKFEPTVIVIEEPQVKPAPQQEPSPQVPVQEQPAAPKPEKLPEPETPPKVEAPPTAPEPEVKPEVSEQPVKTPETPPAASAAPKEPTLEPKEPTPAPTPAKPQGEKKFKQGEPIRQAPRQRT